jgi:ribosome-associated translation inhibitor RaiA
LQVRFHRLGRSPAIEAFVRELADHLGRHYSHLIGCRVTVQAPHHHHFRHDNLYRVRIRMTLPGGELETREDTGRVRGHHDPHVAIRNAFRAARSQLKDFARRERGAVGR